MENAEFVLIIESNLTHVAPVIIDAIATKLSENRLELLQANVTDNKTPTHIHIEYYCDPMQGVSSPLLTSRTSSSSSSTHNRTGGGGNNNSAGSAPGYNVMASRPFTSTATTGIPRFSHIENLGFWTDAPRKHLMAIALDRRLSNGSILYHADFFTITENYTPDEMKQRLYVELINYNVTEKVRVNADGIHSTTYVYSGKSQNGKMKDDLPMALQILNFAHEIWLNQYIASKWPQYIT